MIKDVTKIFDDHLKNKLASKPDVLNFLLKHERKGLCITNLCEQIRLGEFNSSKFGVEKRDRMIEAIAKMFGTVALDARAHEIMSVNEKRRLEDEATKLKEAEGSIQELEDYAMDERVKVVGGLDGGRTADKV